MMVLKIAAWQTQALVFQVYHARRPWRGPDRSMSGIHINELQSFVTSPSERAGADASKSVAGAERDP